MTVPADETLEREKDKLWVIDAELIRRLGIPEKIARAAIRMLDAKVSDFFRNNKNCGETGATGRPSSATSIITTASRQNHPAAGRDTIVHPY
jgi:hypothetical protein